MAILTMIYFKKLKSYRHDSIKDTNVLQPLSISGNIENKSTTTSYCVVSFERVNVPLYCFEVSLLL